MIHFVTSLDPGDANYRHWFTTVPDSLDGSAISIHPTDLRWHLDNNEGKFALLCMYKDAEAFEAIMNLSPEDADRLVLGVIGSDLYSFDFYLEWADRADFFLAPTPEHAALIRSVLNNEVFVIQEPLDPLSVPRAGIQRGTFDGWLYWFGYVESFDKGMQFLLPAIESAVDAGDIAGLRIITTADELDLPPWLQHVPYSEDTMPQILAAAHYVLLSHFPYDLHINSVIKTDNRVLLSLALGAVPLASDTPSYGRLLRRVGLERFLFDGPAGLRRILSDIGADPVGLRGGDVFAIRNVLDQRSPLNTAKRIQNAFAFFDAGR